MSQKAKRRSPLGWVLSLSAVLVLTSCAWQKKPGDSEFYYVNPVPPRCSCLLVMPFGNHSDLKNATDLVGAVVSDRLAKNGNFNGFNYASMLKVLNIEAPPISVEFAMEVARIVEADGVMFGSIGGTWHDEAGQERVLWLDARLLSSRTGEILWVDSRLVRPDPDPKKAQVAGEAALTEALDNMVARLLLEIKPKRTVDRGACLNPQVRESLAKADGKQEPPVVAAAPTKAEPALKLTGTVVAAKPKEPAPVALPKPLEEPAKPRPRTPRELLREAARPVPEIPEPLAAEPEAKPATTPAPKPEAKATGALPPEVEELGHRLQAGEKVLLPGIQFKDRTPTGLTVDEPLVESLGKLMVAQPEMVLEVWVHIDDSKNAEKDLWVTRLQAALVVNELRHRWGVSSERVRAVGKGGKIPLQLNLTERGRKQNRRVEVRLAQ
jgi:hypothetical protein